MRQKGRKRLLKNVIYNYLKSAIKHTDLDNRNLLPILRHC